MKKIVSKLTNRSEFFKNVLVVMSGTAISQIIALAAMPFLSRNYSPSDFGLLATYISVFSIAGSFINGKYERVILLARSIDEVKHSSTLCFIVSVGVSILSLLVVFLGHFFLVDYFNINSGFYYWFYLMPFFLIVYGFNLTILSYLNYTKDFKTISSSRIIKTISSTIFTILGIFYLKNVGGLIIGEFMGYLISTAIVFGKMKGIYDFKLKYLSEIKEIAKKYKSFPLFNIPSDLFNVISVQMPAFFLIAFFGANATGQYSLMKKIIDGPISLFSASILEVFRQKAANEYMNFGNCRILFVKTAKNLALISAPPFIILFIFGPQIFTTIFGNQWYMAGVYARIFAVFYFFKFISSPLSYMFFIAEQSKLDFILHLYIFFSSLLIFYLPKFIVINLEQVLWIYSINFILIYLLYFVYSYKFTINNKFKNEKDNLEYN